MNKQSSLVDRYRPLRNFLMHFKEVLTSQQKIRLGNFISCQWNPKVKTTQHLKHLLDHLNGYGCQWD